MAIYVQWEWQEDTKTFLLILHFDAEFSKRIRNLRVERRALWDSSYGYGENFHENEIVSLSAEDVDSIKQTPEATLKKVGDFSRLRYTSVITWSPSHVEVGVVGELLCQANLINGYKEERRMRLRPYLEFWTDKEEERRWREKYENLAGSRHPPELPDTWYKQLEALDLLKEALGFKKLLVLKRSEQSPLCAELCPEYLDYLKLILEKHAV